MISSAFKIFSLLDKLFSLFFCTSCVLKLKFENNHELEKWDCLRIQDFLNFLWRVECRSLSVNINSKKCWNHGESAFSYFSVLLGFLFFLFVKWAAAYVVLPKRPRDSQRTVSHLSAQLILTALLMCDWFFSEGLELSRVHSADTRTDFLFGSLKTDKGQTIDVKHCASCHKETECELLYTWFQGRVLQSQWTRRMIFFCFSELMREQEKNVVSLLWLLNLSQCRGQT